MYRWIIDPVWMSEWESEWVDGWVIDDDALADALGGWIIDWQSAGEAPAPPVSPGPP